MGRGSQSSASRRIIVGMTGGPGAAFGVRLLEALRDAPVETHLVMCECARGGIETETGLDPDVVRKLADRSYQPWNQAAPISSGSFLTAGMIVAPCSTKSLAAIARGMATNLIHRAADVVVKESRKLVLLVRESPLSSIHMANIDRLASVPGVMVQTTGDVERVSTSPLDVVDQTVGALMDQFSLPHRLG